MHVPSVNSSAVHQTSGGNSARRPALPEGDSEQRLKSTGLSPTPARDVERNPHMTGHSSMLHDAEEIPTRYSRHVDAQTGHHEQRTQPTRRSSARHEAKDVNTFGHSASRAGTTVQDAQLMKRSGVRKGAATTRQSSSLTEASEQVPRLKRRATVQRKVEENPTRHASSEKASGQRRPRRRNKDTNISTRQDERHEKVSRSRSLHATGNRRREAGPRSGQRLGHPQLRVVRSSAKEEAAQRGNSSSGYHGSCLLRPRSQRESSGRAIAGNSTGRRQSAASTSVGASSGAQHHRDSGRERETRLQPQLQQQQLQPRHQLQPQQHQQQHQQQQQQQQQHHEQQQQRRQHVLRAPRSTRPSGPTLAVGGDGRDSRVRSQPRQPAQLKGRIGLVPAAVRSRSRRRSGGGRPVAKLAPAPKPDTQRPHCATGSVGTRRPSGGAEGGHGHGGRCHATLSKSDSRDRARRPHR